MLLLAFDAATLSSGTEQYCITAGAGTSSHAFKCWSPCLHDLHFIDCLQLFLLSETIDADLDSFTSRDPRKCQETLLRLDGTARQLSGDHTCLTTT
jgi:hypothetical protein